MREVARCLLVAAALVLHSSCALQLRAGPGALLRRRVARCCADPGDEDVGAAIPRKPTIPSLFNPVTPPKPSEAAPVAAEAVVPEAPLDDDEVETVAAEVLTGREDEAEDDDDDGYAGGGGPVGGPVGDDTAASAPEQPPSGWTLESEVSPYQVLWERQASRAELDADVAAYRSQKAEVVEALLAEHADVWHDAQPELYSDDGMEYTGPLFSWKGVPTYGAVSGSDLFGRKLFGNATVACTSVNEPSAEQVCTSPHPHRTAAAGMLLTTVPGTRARRLRHDRGPGRDDLPRACGRRSASIGRSPSRSTRCTGGHGARGRACRVGHSTTRPRAS